MSLAFCRNANSQKTQTFDSFTFQDTKLQGTVFYLITSCGPYFTFVQVLSFISSDFWFWKALCQLWSFTCQMYSPSLCVMQTTCTIKSCHVLHLVVFYDFMTSYSVGVCRSWRHVTWGGAVRMKSPTERFVEVPSNNTCTHGKNKAVLSN